MRKRRSFLVSLLLVLMLLFGLAPSTRAGGGIKVAPTPAKPASGTISIMAGTPGSWYVGATPPNVSYSKPVLLFVHGKGGAAESWWTDTVYHGHNDMYDYAYYYGYRTAFVDLYPDKDMWLNGEMLSQQINAITAYFGVPKVTIVAHSKGGVDSNAASAWYGASPKITRVVTLSTPHWGTPIADMAYSTWTWWLAELMGERNDATYVMQTGYMSYFRSITDGRDPTVPYYTLSGNKCGPIGTALWMSCAFIGGQDDGLVSVTSARKPGDHFVYDGYWDHDEIRMGSRSWAYFQPYILTASVGAENVAGIGRQLASAGALPSGAAAAAAATPAVDREEAPGNVILRGGLTGGAAVPAFPVESGVRSARFTIYSSSPAMTATLTGPDGTAYTVQTDAAVPADDVFAGAWAGTVEVAAPQAGAWSLSATAAESTGFLMVAALDSDLQATLAVSQPVATPGALQELTVGFGPGRAVAACQARAEVGPRGKAERGRPDFAAAGNGQKAVLHVPDGNAIHNVTATVTGTLTDGSAFERTLVSSFAAVAPADRGQWK
ncbi:MAG: esterase/lipase family protein [Mycobacterium leprae]